MPVNYTSPAAKDNRDPGGPTGAPLRLAITGGGTGGHLFPGIAIAREWLRRDPQSGVLFVGTDRAFEKKILAESGFAHAAITAAGIKGMGLIKKIRALGCIPKGIWQAAGILARFKPHVVLGVGGYSSGPVALTAWLRRIPVVLHEQNLLPGITNRMLARIARRIYLSFEQTSLARSKALTIITGNPVRSEFLSGGNKENRTDNPFTVLVSGGSQGAHGINTAVCEALECLQNPAALFFIHQTGPADQREVENIYSRQGIQCEVQPFFYDMAARYRTADLVICRAGATTVAEITAMGKAVIFVPFPFAADNHQVLNARTLVDDGAALMVEESDLNGAILAKWIDHFYDNPGQLARMAVRAAAKGKPDAAGTIVDDIYTLLGDL
ncbi:MAG: undecaprenyldiphospho-muramoylpentapeptide beta-N-acetylglucosaminyltransferase [Desulfobacterales bacterium]|nr:undecaprenyldiphospho-muramoylpentapeptide beta-N-acetylglucosaminyltransferase [Desulfobacterales bacterium]